MNPSSAVSATSEAISKATPRTLRELIEMRARLNPERIFLIAPQNLADIADGSVRAASGADAATLSFRQLHDDCRTLETQFRAAGLTPGDVVSVFMGNGIQTARLLLAAMYSGMIANPLNLLSQPSQLRYVVEHSDTHMIFVSSDTEPAIHTALAARPSAPGVRLTRVVRIDPEASTLPTEASSIPVASADGLPDKAIDALLDSAVSYEPRPDDDALLMYTSGTTGEPKGVLLTHRNLLANARNVSAEHRLGADDRVLASLPLYHINGLVVTLLAPLFHGGSVVMTSRFSTGTFWRDVTEAGCTWINVVPTIIAYLINSEEVCSLDLSRLKFCRSASAALPADHHRAFEARFGIGIIETMGMTETAAPVFSNPLESAERRVGSIGRPSGCEARVLGLDGQDCAPLQCGEIVLRGEQVMNRYYKRPDETRSAFTNDGWLRTGDLGYCDADGYFYINGRAKELIIKGGENIAPREIDEALLKHPGVLEAAAVGVPDPFYGQEIVAFVVPRDTEYSSNLPAELHEHCLRELGRYKTPKVFRFVSDLPRGPSGKIQRLKLLNTWADGESQKK